MKPFTKTRPRRLSRLRLKKFTAINWRAGFEREMARACGLARTCAELRRENEALREQIAAEVRCG